MGDACSCGRHRNHSRNLVDSKPVHNRVRVMEMEKFVSGTQNRNVLNYMRAKGSITSLEAVYDLNCLRLSGRIQELRNMGFNIETVMEENNGKRYARYYLKEKENANG